MSKPNPKPTTPLFKDMTDRGLIEAYWGERAAAHLCACMAQKASPRGREHQARLTGRHLRNLDIIVAIARKRGLRFGSGPV